MRPIVRPGSSDGSCPAASGAPDESFRFAIGENQRPLDHVLQFAHVARPALPLEQPQRLARHDSAPAVPARIVPESVPLIPPHLPAVPAAPEFQSGTPTAGNTGLPGISPPLPASAGPHSMPKLPAHPRAQPANCPAAAIPSAPESAKASAAN